MYLMTCKTENRSIFESSKAKHPHKINTYTQVLIFNKNNLDDIPFIKSVKCNSPFYMFRISRVLRKADKILNQLNSV